MPSTLAFAVSSHGFGHAARTSAIIEALLESRPDLRIEIFTAVPPWFFTDWLPSNARLRVHEISVDVGLVQDDPLTIDLPASVARVRDLVDRAPALIADLAARFLDVDADLVIADIAPVALEAAARAGRPSILVENFTWGEIYDGIAKASRASIDEASNDEASIDRQLGAASTLAALGRVFEGWSARATLRIQATPHCRRVADSLTVPVVGRRTRQPASETRAALGIPAEADAVLMTMGGIPWHGAPATAGLAREEPESPYWIVAADVPSHTRLGNVVLLPHRSAFFHPDLVAAADVVVAKLGYSTLAETAIASRALAYVPRPDFPESDHLEAWATRHLETARVEPADFASGSPSSSRVPGVSRTVEAAVDELLTRRGPSRTALPSESLDGARAIAETVLGLDHRSPRTS